MTKSAMLCLRALILIVASVAAHAQESVIRKNLSDRLSQFKKIDEIKKSPIPGLYEVRVNGSDIFYSDAHGNYLVQGSLIDTKRMRNVTKDRVDKLLAVRLDDLPHKDAFKMVRGNGQRKLAVFVDPNCGFCKRFERDLQKIDNVTIQFFLYPVLGHDSVEKSKAIWCAKDPAAAWSDWMLRDQKPVLADVNCDVTALERNLEFGAKYKIEGTPSTFFAGGQRMAGAMDATKLEEMLAAAR